MAKSKTKKDVETIDNSLDDKKYLIKYILSCKKEAEQASKQRRAVQRELWLLYQNKEDWSKKKEWQSKIFIPKVFMAIERASAMVKRAVLQTSKLFTMEMRDEEVAPIEAEIKRLKLHLVDFEGEPETQKVIETSISEQQKKLDVLKEQMLDDEKRFKKELKKSNFTSAYGEMIKSALLLGLGDMKRLWNDSKKKLRFENIDVLNLYISPDYMPFEDENPDYLVEYKEMSLAKLRRMAKDNNVFDMDEINNIKADYTKEQNEENSRQRRGLSQYSKVSKNVGILEFWGTVVSEDGKEMKENQLMMLANEKYLIRKQDNPFADGRYPHDLTVPMVYPHRGIAGVSLVESEVRLQYTLNNVMNMVVDNLNFVVNKVMTYQPSALKRPQDIFTIYPGKMIPVNVSGDVLKEVRLSPLSNDVFKVFDMLGKEMQEASAVTEFLMGMPGKQAKTLGEIEIKTAESQGLFDVIARELEMNSIKPILKGSYGILKQFSDFTGDYGFNVGGLSLLLLKKEQVQTLMQAMMLALKTPELRQSTDVAQLWKRLLDIWNLSETYKEPEEQSETGLLLGGKPVQGQEITPDQREMIKRQAALKAKEEVSRMSPEAILSS